MAGTPNNKQGESDMENRIAEKLRTLNASPNLSVLLSCTRCGEKQGTHSEITYSQGDRVCYPCEEETEEADKRAFDRDMRFRR